MSPSHAGVGSAITVRDVSKTFRLYTDKPSDLKQAITRLSRARYEEFVALHDVNLDVPGGESFGLVGHNGSGKSTLLRLMARIHQPTSGKVTTHGRVSALLELGAGFHPELSGRENIYLNGAILGLKKRDLDAVFDEIVAFAGLERCIDSPVKVYSSGMYVRLGFAVAVHVDPDILMIDEVIAVGDEEFQRRCMDHLFKLRRDGVTIVLVSHSLPIMQNLCDRLAWLDHGVLQQVGPPGQVVRGYLGQVDDAEEQRLGEHGGAEVTDAKHALRHGTREIEITHFEVLKSGGEPVLMPESNSAVVFRVHYEAHEPVQHPKFGIDFETETGVLLAGHTTTDDGVITGTVTGPGYVDCVVDRLPFNPGVLLVSIGITDEHEMHTYDHLYQAYELRVRQGEAPEDRGLIRLAGRWSSPTPDGARELLG
jgi:ABC-2 type transport system ATP-binding protein/lipopolysaccharide transport system ATP-binding protein